MRRGSLNSVKTPEAAEFGALQKWGNCCARTLKVEETWDKEQQKRLMKMSVE
jgi:hypothetical protein